MQRPIVTGVGSIHELNFDAVFYGGLHEYDVAWVDHLHAECDDPDHCEHEIEQTVCYYSDRQFFSTDLSVAWLDAHADQFLLKVNWDRGTYQVLKSPVTELHGWCSPCYPGQADVDSDGDVECYVLPEEYRR